MRNCAHPLLCSIREEEEEEEEGGDAEVTVDGTVSGEASIIGHAPSCSTTTQKKNVAINIRTKSCLDISPIPLNL